MSFIKSPPKKKIKKNIERKNKKKSLSKQSEKLRADRITTLGGSGVHSPFFFSKRIYLFVLVTSFHFFYEPL